MKNCDALFTNFSSGIGNPIASSITPFMDADGADIELMINLHARKCDQAVLRFDREKLHFGYAHKAPDDYVYLFGEADQKRIQDGRSHSLLMI
jgi:hypothetical protein